MSGPDALYMVRNYFWIGAYQMAINEASDIEALSDAEKAERDCFVYRSYLELGSYNIVLDEITDDKSMALQAVKLMAEYLTKAKSKEDTLATLAGWLEDEACNTNPNLLLVAGCIFAQEADYVQALKSCHSGLSLEMMALCVQVYIRMGRTDEAEKQLKKMAQADDDAVIAQLATAWVSVTRGGGKVTEAFHTYRELADRYQWTPKLLAGKAVCQMKMNRFEEAEKDLMEAYSKDSKDPDILANLVVCTMHLAKSTTSRYLSQLQEVRPNHELLKRANQFEDQFMRAAATIA